MVFNGLCLSQCPVFYYLYNNITCLPCPNLCSSCLNSTYCTSCIAAYLSNNLCVKNCPSMTYVYQSLSCIPCKSPCLTCVGDFTCLTCLPGYIYFHSYCVVTCPTDVWYYPSNNSCQASCPYNKYSLNMTCYVDNCGDYMVSLSGYCLLQCGQGYYVGSQRNCLLCSTSQEMCTTLLF